MPSRTRAHAIKRQPNRRKTTRFCSASCLAWPRQLIDLFALFESKACPSPLFWISPASSTGHYTRPASTISTRHQPALPFAASRYQSTHPALLWSVAGVAAAIHPAFDCKPSRLRAARVKPTRQQRPQHADNAVLDCKSTCMHIHQSKFNHIPSHRRLKPARLDFSSDRVLAALHTESRQFGDSRRQPVIQMQSFPISPCSRKCLQIIQSHLLTLLTTIKTGSPMALVSCCLPGIPTTPARPSHYSPVAAAT